jgi:hypothetical protein
MHYVTLIHGKSESTSFGHVVNIRRVSDILSTHKIHMCINFCFKPLTLCKYLCCWLVVLWYLVFLDTRMTTKKCIPQRLKFFVLYDKVTCCGVYKWVSNTAAGKLLSQNSRNIPYYTTEFVYLYFCDRTILKISLLHKIPK